MAPSLERLRRMVRFQTLEECGLTTSIQQMMTHQICRKPELVYPSHRKSRPLLGTTKEMGSCLLVMQQARHLHFTLRGPLSIQSAADHLHSFWNTDNFKTLFHIPPHIIGFTSWDWSFFMHRCGRKSELSDIFIGSFLYRIWTTTGKRFMQHAKSTYDLHTNRILLLADTAENWNWPISSGKSLAYRTSIANVRHFLECMENLLCDWKSEMLDNFHWQSSTANLGKYNFSNGMEAYNTDRHDFHNSRYYSHFVHNC
jgi:hypothetical protein